MDENVTPNDEKDVEDAAPEQEEAPAPEEKTEAEEAAEETTEEVNEAEEETSETIPVQTPPTDRLDVRSIVNEDGTVDLDKMQAWADGVQSGAERRAATTVSTQLEETRQWERVYDKYPEWKENKKMRDLVHKQRIGNLYAGGKNDLVKAADTIKELMGSAESQGKEKAQTSITRQKAASLETASTADAVDSSQEERRRLMGQVGSKNRQEADSARHALLKDMIEKGEI